MKPGEIIPAEGNIELNAGRQSMTLTVSNTKGFRLDIPSGTAIRFEPGQTRDVKLVAISGARKIYGFNQAVMGPLDKGE